MHKYKTAVVCTSTASLDEVPEKPEAIRTLRLNIHTKNGDFRDGKDMKSLQFYQYLTQNANEIPSTSPPAFDDIAQLFLRLSEEGYTDVIVPTLAASFSETAKIISDTASLVRRQINVHVFETGTIGILEGIFSLEAARLVKDGATPLEIITHLNRIKHNLHLFFEVDSLKYLVKNGRISTVKGFIGTLIRLKPVLHLHNGKMEIIGKVRSTEKAMELVADKAADLTAGRRAKFFGLHTSESELYQQLEYHVRQAVAANANIRAFPLSAVVGAHIGPQAAGIGVWLQQ